MHTAEHIFARALQNAGVNLHVLMVDTASGSVGTAIFKEKIDYAVLTKAEHETNAVVREGLKIEVETFADLNEAKAKFPNLRLYEERLKGKESFRLVKIGDYDYAMCKNEHVDDTSQIKAFVLKRVSYPNAQTKIEFFASDVAIDYLVALNDTVMEQGTADNFESEKIADRYRNALKDTSKCGSALEEFFSAMLASGKRVFRLKESEINIFYKTAKSYVEENPGECVTLLNKTQITCVWGDKCTIDMEGMGRALKESSAMSGVVKKNSINGRINDEPSAFKIIKRFIGAV